MKNEEERANTGDDEKEGEEWEADNVKCEQNEDELTVEVV